MEGEVRKRGGGVGVLRHRGVDGWMDARERMGLWASGRGERGPRRGLAIHGDTAFWAGVVGWARMIPLDLRSHLEDEMFSRRCALLMLSLLYKGVQECHKRTEWASSAIDATISAIEPAPTEPAEARSKGTQGIRSCLCVHLIRLVG